MRTKIVRIGNSLGVRIPKPLLEQAGLHDEVELQVFESRIVLQAPVRPRQDWAEAAATLEARDDDGLLDDYTATDFDDDWVWDS